MAYEDWLTFCNRILYASKTISKLIEQLFIILSFNSEVLCYSVIQDKYVFQLRSFLSITNYDPTMQIKGKYFSH